MSCLYDPQKMNNLLKQFYNYNQLPNYKQLPNCSVGNLQVNFFIFHPLLLVFRKFYDDVKKALKIYFCFTCVSSYFHLLISSLNVMLGMPHLYVNLPSCRIPTELGYGI